jgi:hypothetical protein
MTRNQTQARPVRRVIAALAAVLAAAACGEGAPTAPTATTGLVMVRDSLLRVDGMPVPCCALDTSGTGVMVVGGALTLYRGTNYVDSVFVPSGITIPAACSLEVPNGSAVALNGVVTWSDGSAHLFPYCSSGTYSVILAERRVLADGSSRTTFDTLSWGTFSWKWDTLTIVAAEARGPLAESLSDTTVTVTTPDHSYQFGPVPTVPYWEPAQRHH